MDIGTRLDKLVLVAGKSADWSALYAQDGDLLTQGHLLDVMERIVDALPIQRVWDDAVYEERRERGDRTPTTFAEFEQRSRARTQLAIELVEARARVEELEKKLK